jgi:hypothetical protein
LLRGRVVEEEAFTHRKKREQREKSEENKEKEREREREQRALYQKKNN